MNDNWLWYSIILFVWIAVISYRECQILVDRGSWHPFYFWIKFWYIEWTSFWKDFDSFHVMNGLSTLLLLEILVHHLYHIVEVTNFITYQLNVVIYWLIVMYIRNLFIHVIFRMKGYRESKYIIPLIGKLIWRKS